MRKTLQILITLLLTFTLPLLTSWLLDWSWIQGHWTRQTMIILLMLTQVIILGYILVLIIKKKEK